MFERFGGLECVFMSIPVTKYINYLKTVTGTMFRVHKSDRNCDDVTGDVALSRARTTDSTRNTTCRWDALTLSNAHKSHTHTNRHKTTQKTRTHKPDVGCWWDWIMVVVVGEY